MDYKLVSYIHLLHTCFFHTYCFIDNCLIPIWILHLSIIILSWGFTNYTCPMTILENKTRVSPTITHTFRQTDTNIFLNQESVQYSNNYSNMNWIEKISHLTTIRNYKILVLSWFILLVLYGFWSIGFIYGGIIYIIALVKSLFLIKYKKYDMVLFDMDLDKLMSFFYFYCTIMIVLLFYVSYIICINLGTM